MKYILLFLAASLGAHAQSNWSGAGIAYGSPHVNGWASYAHRISEPALLYSFTSMDITAAHGQPQTSVRTGVATVIRSVGPVTVLGFGESGMATTASGFGGAFDGGGVAIIRLGRGGLTLAVAARVLHTAMGGTQTVWEVGFGRAY